MKRILLLAFSILSLSILRSQTAVNLNWLDAMGATVAGDEKINRSFTDASGNIYITGQLSGNADMDPSAATYSLYGNYSSFIAKYTPAGVFVWANGCAGGAQSEGKALGVDGAGNVYLAGTFNGSLDCDPSVSNFPLVSNGPSDMFIFKYSSSGAFQWGQGMGALSSAIKPECVQVSAAGDIFIGGNLNVMSPVNFNPTGPSYTLTGISSAADAFLVKYNSSGLIQWGFTMGDMMSDYVYDMALDASNNVFIVGTYQTSIGLDPAAPTNTVASQGLEDGYVAKYTSAGNFVWGKVVGDVLGDGFYRMAFDNTGDLLLSGYMESSTMDADPSAAVFNLSKVGIGVSDIVVGKYSASTGNFMWAKNAGGYDEMHTRAIASDSQNNIYLLGDFNDEADFDLTAATYTLPVTASSYHDIYLAKYDDVGNLIYAKTIGGAPSTDNFARGVHVNSSNDIVITGVHSGSLDVDFNSTNNLNTFGGSDIFLVGYSQCIDAGTPTLAVTMQTMCANGVATLSISGGNLNSATDWVWYGLACGTGSFASGTTATVSPILPNNTYYVNGEGGCTNPGPCASASVVVDASNDITGIVTTNTAGPVPITGMVQLFRYEGPLTKWDSVTYQNLNASGIYTFNAVNSGSYIIMCIPTSTTLVKTYAPSNTTWKNATVFSHGCVANYTINIDVVPMATITPGPGVLAGKIVEGTNYGGRGVSVAPGNPIGGLTIKGGRNPGGNIVAQGRTNSSGEYTISGLPISGPGETYFVFVDIPGNDTAGTHHRAITSGTTMYTDIDFVVDSDYVRPVDYTGIKELKLAGELVRVYPNPARDLVYIQLDAKNESSISLELYNLFGKKILSENYTAVQSEFKTSIDVGKLPRGIYFVKLKLNTGDARIKLVLSE
jgi:hypothetical protein